MTTAVEKMIDLGLSFQIEGRSVGKLSPSQKAKILGNMPSADVAACDDLFGWTAVIASRNVTRDGIQLTSRSLDMIRDELKRGISFMGSTSLRELPIGASYEGSRSADRVTGGFYTVPGMRPGTTSSDSFILGVQSGIIRAVQAVLTDGQITCSVCSGDPFDWTGGGCGHVVGMRYDQNGKPNKNGVPMRLILDQAVISAVCASHQGNDEAATIQEVMRAKAEHLAARGELVGPALAATRAAAAGRWVRPAASGAPVVTATTTPASISSTTMAILPDDAARFMTGWSHR